MSPEICPPPRFPDPVSILMALVYPVMIILFIRVLAAENPGRWEWVLLHMLLVLSSGVLWVKVRTGYNFMIG